MVEKVQVGIIGTGNIAPRYVTGCGKYDILDVVACADIDMKRAQAFAEEHGLRALTVDDLLADPDIQIVINLTIPAAHKDVSLQIISAGKHPYSEKPLALNREDGAEILAAADQAGVRVGCAPDTFLGAGGQTCRKIIDDGWIGTPVGATAFMAIHGHEHWHPNPEFYYQAGGGPMFDMGPYYVTALVNLLGPVKRVAASTRTSFEERTITSQPKYGQSMTVEVTTHITGTMDFESGAIGTIITSFDVWKHSLPIIEIYGSLGTLSVPDPNHFQGPVSAWLVTEGEKRELPITHSAERMRGSGVADMAYALQSNRPHRASGELALHVLDIMQSFDESSESGEHVTLESTCERPVPLPTGLLDNELDD